MNDTLPALDMDLEAQTIYEAARKTEGERDLNVYTEAEWDEQFKKNLTEARRRAGLPT